jgi:hypothetical protein
LASIALNRYICEDKSFDFAKLAAGQVPKFPMVRIANVRGPSFGRSRTYGDWPNIETRTTVPANASLRGEHLVRGNYSPDIRFSVGERTDFMEAPAFQPLTRTAGASVRAQCSVIALMAPLEAM